MSEPVTLSPVGLSIQEGTVVSVAANLLAALDVSIQVLDAGDLSGDIVLLNPASEAGRSALTGLGARQRALLLVDSETEGAGHTALVRPVRVQTLRDTLVELVARLPSGGARAAPPASSAKTAAPLSAAPAAAAASGPLPVTLFYLLVDAVLNRALVRVDCGGGTLLLIHGPTRCVYTRADGMTLEKLAQQGAEMLQVQRLSESAFMQASNGMSLTRLHDVIWLAERHGSRGQLLPGHGLDVPVQLKVWPKFNNRHVRPEYLKLAAMLSKQPLSLRNLAEASGVPLPQVIDFYNASAAFEVLEKVESAPQRVPPKPPASGGLLGKIARRLALKRD